MDFLGEPKRCQEPFIVLTQIGVTVQRLSRVRFSRILQPGFDGSRSDNTQSSFLTVVELERSLTIKKIEAFGGPETTLRAHRERSGNKES